MEILDYFFHKMNSSTHIIVQVDDYQVIRPKSKVRVKHLNVLKKYQPYYLLDFEGHGEIDVYRNVWFGDSVHQL